MSTTGAATVRPAAVADAGPLLVVQRSAFLSEAQAYGDPFIPPLVETLAEVVAAIDGGGVLVATHGERLVGSIRYEVAGTVCHVARLSVAGDLQGRGIGSRLLEAVERAVAGRAVTTFALHTGADSPHNIRLYERHGYHTTGVERLNNKVSFVHMVKVRPARSA